MCLVFGGEKPRQSTSKVNIFSGLWCIYFPFVTIPLQVTTVQNIVGPREDKCGAFLSHYLFSLSGDKNQVILNHRNTDLGVLKHMLCSVYIIPRGSVFQSRGKMAKNFSTQLCILAQLMSTNLRKKGVSQHCSFSAQHLSKKFLRTNKCQHAV